MQSSQVEILFKKAISVKGKVIVTLSEHPKVEVGELSSEIVLGRADLVPETHQKQFRYKIE